MAKKGFTLLEILIVLTVIAILIGIALPRIKGMQDEANIMKVKADLKTLQVAVEAYKMNTGSLPGPADPNSLCEEYLLTRATPQMISAPLYDSFNSTPNKGYLYDFAGSHNQYYIIASVGPQGDSVAYDTTEDGTGEWCVIHPKNGTILLTSGICVADEGGICV